MKGLVLRKISLVGSIAGEKFFGDHKWQHSIELGGNSF